MSTFLDVVELLLTNSEAKSSYTENPDAFMESHGLESLDSNDVADAMTHASNALPLPVSVLLDPSNGLDSAAGVNLAESGLSLDREPMFDKTEDHETEDVVVDPYGADVPFDSDVPDGLDDVVDALDAPNNTDDDSTEAPLTTEAPAAPREIIESAPVQELTTSEVDDYLTDTPIDVPYLDGVDPLETLDDTTLDSTLELEDSDPADDMPDDFDLLD